MTFDPELADLELRLLFEAIFHRYQYDFRQYTAASMKRRVGVALSELQCPTISRLQEWILHDSTVFPTLLRFLTIQVSDLFRDPTYYRAIRTEVAPLLATYPSLKLWVAGCSSGEEAYSLAILLSEVGLLDRTLIYATDINPDALRQAASGAFELERMAKFSANYLAAGGEGSLSDYYTAAYGHARFHARLRDRIVFSDHDLATDAVFSEVHLVSCRNVLIYFDRPLQDRAFGLFAEALIRGGFLGLGSKESIRFSSHAAAFDGFVEDERLYRKR
ncbi:MAG: CheR family methyltransferase [Myxococcota bacterium]